MTGYITNIEEKAQKNRNFREVLFTSKNSQLVIMSLKPGEDIGMEIHADVDQFIRIEKGKGVAILDGEKSDISDGSAVVIPQGTEHNIVNKSESEELKLYTIYSPAHHKDGTIIHATKEDALKDEEDHL